MLFKKYCYFNELDEDLRNYFRELRLMILENPGICIR